MNQYKLKEGNKVYEAAIKLKAFDVDNYLKQYLKDKKLYADGRRGDKLKPIKLETHIKDKMILKYKDNWIPMYGMFF